MAISMTNVRGQRRAYIDFLEQNGRPKLRELWFMWSFCNLSCAHCYVDSSPANHTLQMPSLDEVKPFLREAARFGVEHVYYTGGEPFANPEIIPMLEASLEIAPVTVLTNATRPVERHLDALERLSKRRPGKLALRVSLDHFEREKHDAVRGPGAFERTVANAKELVQRGLRVILTSTPLVYEGTPVTREEAVQAYSRLLDGRAEVKVLPFTLQMGAETRRSGPPPETPFLTEQHLKKARVEDYQCHYSRCVQKIGGRMRVYPCPIIYNDPDYELGSTLEESFRRVYLGHHGCVFFCYKAGGKCGDDSPPASGF